MPCRQRSAGVTFPPLEGAVRPGVSVPFPRLQSPGPQAGDLATCLGAAVLGGHAGGSTHQGQCLC